MLDLALCDDEAEQLDIVGRLLRDYVQARPELAIRLSVFSSGRDLLAAEEEGARFDICVLDVVMPELSGIELGIELRERGSASAIIYLTISPEYAVDSYAAKAFYYLVKPPERNGSIRCWTRRWRRWKSAGRPASPSRCATVCAWCGSTRSYTRNGPTGRSVTIWRTENSWTV